MALPARVYAAGMTGENDAAQTANRVLKITTIAMWIAAIPLVIMAVALIVGLIALATILL